MNFIAQLLPRGTDAHGLAALSLAVVVGMVLGAVRVKGIRLGVSGVLFSGLLFGQLGFTMDATALSFIRDFALIIFMYALGLQVGPGFVSSFRSEGLRLNVLAVAAVVLGAVITAGIVAVGRVEKVSASGLYSGAYTTTPGLAAGQEALRQKFRADADKEATARAETGLAYAVTYPFGLIGPILVIVALKRIFKIKIADELAELNAEEEHRRPPVETVDLDITQPAHAGVALRDLSTLKGKGVVFTRMLRNSVVSAPNADTVIAVGDTFRAAGPRPALNEIVNELGRHSSTDLGKIAGDIGRSDLVVTRTAVLRRSLRELDLTHKAGVTIARVTRAGVDLLPRANLKLNFGDQVVAVGPDDGLKMVEAQLGNSPDILNRPQLIPIFLGIVLGVMVGSIPLALPGLGATVRIGLAGGPMVAAIALAQLGNIGSIVWYIPSAALQLFRDFGLAVFLACVGVQSGGHFIEKLAQGGFIFVLWGAVITVLPVLAIGFLARAVWKMNFVTLTGWIAGSLTNSPALIFAEDLTKSDAPAVAYAAVAPLAMLSPVICAQLLVVFMH